MLLLVTMTTLAAQEGPDHTCGIEGGCPEAALCVKGRCVDARLHRRSNRLIAPGVILAANGAVFLVGGAIMVTRKPNSPSDPNAPVVKKLGFAFIGVGAGLLALSVPLLVLGILDRKKSRAHVSFTPLPGGGMLGLSARF
jgi:hypothetical protein